LFDPDTVTVASGRATTTLDSLVNGDANGNWYLYIADLETGGTMQLNAWSLSFSEVSAVPEPASALSVAGMLASALLLRNRRRLNPSS
jgi:subtilisin-like proprotein convertase family protein